MSDFSNLSQTYNEIKDKITVSLEEKYGKGNITRGLAIYLLKGALPALYSFFLASCPTLFSAYPLAVAYLSASEGLTFFKLAGCIAGALTLDNDRGLPYAISYCVILMLRLLYSRWLSKDKRLFKEDHGIRAMIALITAVLISVYFCFYEGFTLHSLGALLFMSGISLSLTYIFSWRLSKINPIYRGSAEAAMGLCLVYSMSKYSVFGFSPVYTVCTALSVYYAYSNDLLSCTVLSLVSSLGCKDPSLSPMFALISLFIGIIKRINERLAVPSGLLIGFCYAFWVYKGSSFLLVLPDIISGGLVSIPIIHYLKGKGQEDIKENEDGFYSEYNAGALSKQISHEMTEQLEELSITLENISQNLRRPVKEDVMNICNDICSEKCSSCRSQKNCYAGCNYESSELMRRMSDTLFETGYIQMADLPRSFSDTCRNSREILYEINNEYAELAGKLLSEDSNKVFASGYRSIAKIITEAEEKREKETSLCRELSLKARSECDKLKISAEGVYVYGTRRKTLIMAGLDNSSLGVSAEKLKSVFSSLLNCPMSSPYIENIKGKWQLKMEALPRIEMSMATATRTRDGESVCGDSVHSFSSNDGYCYTVLSDGMGSGKTAALVSRICCIFTEKLSLCGGSMKTVIEAVNSYILSQSYECSATVDMLRIDRYTSGACFVKSGAAPSMIIRGGHVYRISSKTIPIGVVRQLNTEQVTLPLRVGDYVILTSDGVTPDLESGLCIADIIASSPETSPESLAKTIIENAVRSTDRHDDMSVAVIKIDKAV